MDYFIRLPDSQRKNNSILRESCPVDNFLRRLSHFDAINTIVFLDLSLDDSAFVRLNNRNSIEIKKSDVNISNNPKWIQAKLSDITD